MKAIKILVLGFATLLPTFSVARTITYSYPAALSSPEDGRRVSAAKKKIVLGSYEGVRYSVRVTNSCKERCKLNSMDGCSPLENFQLVARCADQRGEGNVLKDIGARKACSDNESLTVVLQEPCKTPGTVSFDIAITFDDEKMHVLDVIGKLRDHLPQEFVDQVVEQEREKLRVLEAQLAAAEETAARSTAERQQAEIEHERAIQRAADSQRALNASNMALLAALDDLANRFGGHSS